MSSEQACEVIDSTSVQHIQFIKLWRLKCDGSDGPSPRPVRSKAPSGAVEDSFTVDPSLCASYWVSFQNARSLESCLSNGVGLGSPLEVPVVQDRKRRLWGLYDVMGRRLRGKPERSGRYFGDRDTVVVR